MALQAKLDQAVEQFGIGNAAGLPELGIHADLREAGHRVDLVEIDRARILVEEEVHSRQPAQVQRDERLHRHAPDIRRRLLWNLRRDGEARGVVEILGAIVVELAAGRDLTDDAGDGFVVAQRGAL